mmetsp:Transcript_36490/g.85174  ORF Transcript_36490/g.85174 Transcript_36490/m.85174 type:complete len:235 (+) Transcript_36490:221-925(+)
MLTPTLSSLGTLARTRSVWADSVRMSSLRASRMRQSRPCSSGLRWATAFLAWGRQLRRSTTTPGTSCLPLSSTRWRECLTRRRTSSQRSLRSCLAVMQPSFRWGGTCLAASRVRCGPPSPSPLRDTLSGSRACGSARRLTTRRSSSSSGPTPRSTTCPPSSTLGVRASCCLRTMSRRTCSSRPTSSTRTACSPGPRCLSLSKAWTRASRSRTRTCSSSTTRSWTRRGGPPSAPA